MVVLLDSSPKRYLVTAKVEELTGSNSVVETPTIYIESDKTISFNRAYSYTIYT